MQIKKWSKIVQTLLKKCEALTRAKTKDFFLKKQFATNNTSKKVCEGFKICLFK